MLIPGSTSLAIPRQFHAKIPRSNFDFEVWVISSYFLVVFYDYISWYFLVRWGNLCSPV